MSQLGFFRNGYHEESVFFDEGPRIPTKKTSSKGTFYSTSSMETVAIDAWRQGVELTQQKHYDAGVVKIYAGEPGHVMLRSSYGVNKNLRLEPVFQDLDYFDPVLFLRLQDRCNRNVTIDKVFTFPIITSDNDQMENYMLDGIIEPLTIRACASFFSIDVPFEAHAVKGALMGGNIDPRLASDQVQTVHVRDAMQQQPFIDLLADAVIFAEMGASIGHVSMNFGFFSTDASSLSPFVDARYARNVASKVGYEASMESTLSQLQGSTDNYVATVLDRRSAVSGWEYDNNAEVGTDSLTFGGMVF